MTGRLCEPLALAVPSLTNAHGRDAALPEVQPSRRSAVARLADVQAHPDDCRQYLHGISHVICGQLWNDSAGADSFTSPSGYSARARRQRHDGSWLDGSDGDNASVTLDHERGGWHVKHLISPYSATRIGRRRASAFVIATSSVSVGQSGMCAPGSAQQPQLGQGVSLKTMSAIGHPLNTHELHTPWLKEVSPRRAKHARRADRPGRLRVALVSRMHPDQMSRRQHHRTLTGAPRGNRCHHRHARRHYLNDQDIPVSHSHTFHLVIVPSSTTTVQTISLRHFDQRNSRPTTTP